MKAVPAGSSPRCRGGVLAEQVRERHMLEGPGEEMQAMRPIRGPQRPRHRQQRRHADAARRPAHVGRPAAARNCRAGARWPGGPPPGCCRAAAADPPRETSSRLIPRVSVPVSPAGSMGEYWRTRPFGRMRSIWAPAIAGGRAPSVGSSASATMSARRGPFASHPYGADQAAEPALGVGNDEHGRRERDLGPGLRRREGRIARELRFEHVAQGFELLVDVPEPCPGLPDLRHSLEQGRAECSDCRRPVARTAKPNP